MLDLVIFIPIVLLVEGAVLLARHNLGSKAGASPIDKVPRCSYCGTKLKKGNLFCASCGRAVS